MKRTVFGAVLALAVAGLCLTANAQDVKQQKAKTEKCADPSCGKKTTAQVDGTTGASSQTNNRKTKKKCKECKNCQCDKAAKKAKKQKNK